MSTEELLAEALRLPRQERARVAEELLSSLEESDEEVATAWAEELERRARDVAEGRVQTYSLGERQNADREGTRATACAPNCILKRVPNFEVRSRYRRAIATDSPISTSSIPRVAHQDE